MKNTVFIVIIGALALIGCQGGGTAATTDFRSGTSGLEIEFLENAPPRELFAGTDAAPSEFQIGIGLRNAGASDITDGVLFIDYAEFLTVEGKEAGGRKFFAPLAGKSIGNQEGEYKVMFIDAANIGTDAEEKIATLSAHACYRYRTAATVDICIDTTKQGLLNPVEKSCESNKVNSLGRGQGAPVAVAEVRESIIPRAEGNELRLDIAFEDRGDRSKNEKVRGYAGTGCTGESSIFVREVRFSDYSTKELGSKRIECRGSNFDGRELRMEAGDDRDPTREDKIVCSVLLEKTLNPYLTPLIIEVEYGYQTAVEHTFKLISPEYISPDTIRLPAAFAEDEFCTTIAPHYDDIIREHAIQFSIDPCLIMAIIQQESGFDPYAQGPPIPPSGNRPTSERATGLMQIRPSTAEEVGVTELKLFDPNSNVFAGTAYFAKNRKRFMGKGFSREESTKMAIAAHHGGPNRVEDIAVKYPDNWLDHLTAADPLGKATKDYVREVIARWDAFRQQKEKV